MQTEAAPNPFYTEFGKCEIMKKFKEDNIVYAGQSSLRFGPARSRVVMQIMVVEKPL
jgi:hypothetical protein